jgi:hypothetical protein
LVFNKHASTIAPAEQATKNTKSRLLRDARGGLKIYIYRQCGQANQGFFLKEALKLQAAFMPGR